MDQKIIGYSHFHPSLKTIFNQPMNPSGTLSGGPSMHRMSKVLTSVDRVWSIDDEQREVPMSDVTLA